MNDYQNTLDELMDLVIGIGKLREVAYVKYSELSVRCWKRRSPMNSSWNRSWMVSAISVMRTVSLSYTEVSAGIFTTNIRNS